MEGTRRLLHPCSYLSYLASTCQPAAGSRVCRRRCRPEARCGSGGRGSRARPVASVMPSIAASGWIAAAASRARLAASPASKFIPRQPAACSDRTPQQPYSSLTAVWGLPDRLRLRAGYLPAGGTGPRRRCGTGNRFKPGGNYPRYSHASRGATPARTWGWAERHAVGGGGVCNVHHLLRCTKPLVPHSGCEFMHF